MNLNYESIIMVTITMVTIGSYFFKYGISKKNILSKEKEPFLKENNKKVNSIDDKINTLYLKITKPYLKEKISKLFLNKNVNNIWNELREILISADIGVGTTDEIIKSLEREISFQDIKNPEQLLSIIKQQLINIIDKSMKRSISCNEVPAIFMLVGVNGVGKTTTIAKFAHMYLAQGKKVLLCAADTFRAAAVEQLTTWGNSLGIETIQPKQSEKKKDPASVAFEAVRKSIENNLDIVLIDTAGRLQNKTDLMDELKKIKRVIEKQKKVSEILLIIDATTGQNGLTQAKVFAKAIDITGIVLTKFDGTAKGGIIISIQQELGVPVKFIGLGEKSEDLIQFNSKMFVDAIFR